MPEYDPREKRVTFFDEPLIAQVVLKDPRTGEALYIAEDVTVMPGETVSWQYPPEGLTISMA